VSGKDGSEETEDRDSDSDVEIIPDDTPLSPSWSDNDGSLVSEFWSSFDVLGCCCDLSDSFSVMSSI
jgi:hypothetical protein